VAAFATTAELTTFLGSDAVNARGTLMLDLASAAIRRFTGQTLDVVTGAQEEFGPTTLETLVLTQRPVTAVSVVQVNAVTVTDYIWTRWGTIRRDPDSAWSDGATVTYDHGYAPTEPEMVAIKGVCLEAAGRAFTREPSSGVENFGAPAEAVGWAPQIVLTQEEQTRLRDFGAVMVG
jgi:hypothetical protein